MGNDFLYKWEDSPALKHHCGFCGRPLSHPGARSSCFGIHAEPCHRFHQAMFMRNRAHMCAMCNGADEAHHKRHQDMAERLRGIYESCGEDWPIIPSDEPERGRARTRESESLDDDARSSASGGAHAKKKDKKEQKRLVRAASRRHVITLDEVKYIESVLHPASTNGDAEGPRNPEEIDEIENHLRYNAQVYNDGLKRCVMKEFARISDADVDFKGEMGRILDILRIAELLKRNTKNRGLMGRDLKYFEELVTEFKERVVEDLLLLKKDEMEVRMRRASYLRYTNRASFDIVEERYAVKDWRTGLKFSESPTVRSISSGSIHAIEEECEEENEEGDDGSTVDWRQETDLSSMPSDGPDLRHLLHGHKRIGSGGKPEEFVSIRRSPTRTPTKPQGVSKRKHPLQLRIVPNAGPEIRDLSLHHLPVSIRSENIQKPSPPRSSPGPPSKHDAPPALRRNCLSVAKSRAQPVEAYVEVAEATPEPTLPGIKIVSLKPPEQAEVGHPIVVQKKAKKKKQPEADRKARMTAEHESGASSEAAVDEDHDTIESALMDAKDVEAAQDSESRKESEKHIIGATVFPTNVMTNMDMSRKGKASREVASAEVSQHQSSTPIPIGKPMQSVFCEANRVKISARKNTKQSEVTFEVAVPVISSSTSATARGVPYPPAPQKATEVTNTCHHGDWKKYTRHLIVDGLSCPDITFTDSCTHAATCAFDMSNTIDCPIHEPYRSHSDPRKEHCFVVYPNKGAYYEGPFNGPRAQKLFAYYEAQPRTKGKLMLVDDDMLSWLMQESLKVERGVEAFSKNMPTSLCYEVSEYFAGEGKGRLMRQTELYRHLAFRNNDSEEPVSRNELRQIYDEFKQGCGGNPKICYCEVQHTNDTDLVECNFRHCQYHVFHEDCVKDLAIEKVSTWYCPDCEEMLDRIARMVLTEVECMHKGMQVPGPRAVDLLTGGCKPKEMGAIA